MKNRSLYYLFILATIALGTWAATSLTMETDVSTYNLASPQAIQHYQQFIKPFEEPSATAGEHSIIILEKTEGWQGLEDFQLLRDITDFWKSREEVKSVSSLSHLKYPKKGLLRSRQVPFLDFNQPERVRERLAQYDTFADIFQKFLSKDKRYTLLFIETAEGISTASAKAWELLNLEEQKVHIHYLQYDLLQQELASYMRKDSILLAAFSLALILASFYCFTYSLKGLGMIAVMVAFNIAVTLLCMQILDMSFTMHTITVPCLITVLSFTDIMHIMYHQKELRNQATNDQDLQQQIREAVKIPLLLTSLTNIAGLIIFLLLSENKHLFNYALLSIIGVGTAYSSARFMVIPLMTREGVYLKRNNFQGLYALHQGVFNSIQKYKTLVFAVGLTASICLATYVFVMFEVESTAKGFMIENTPFSRSKAIIETGFFGEKQAEILIETPQGKLWTKPVLDSIERIETQVQQLFNPLFINSPTVVAKRYHRYSQNGSPNNYYIPKQLSKYFVRELTKHQSSLGGNGIIHLPTGKARIIFGFEHDHLKELRAKYRALEHQLKRSSNETVSFKLAGLQYLSDEAVHSFSYKILLGFGASILCSSLLILMLFKSIRTAALLLLVNLLPIFVALALMIMVEIAITPLTLFLLSILLGICVDDSIYLVTQQQSTARKIHILPIFITSLVLSLGFLALSFSSFVWIQPFGWIFLIGILLAYLLDIFILNLLLHRTPSFDENG